ncbi:hypothetical protein ACRAWD_30015 [Caulobacter segnis]
MRVKGVEVELGQADRQLELHFRRAAAWTPKVHRGRRRLGRGPGAARITPAAPISSRRQVDAGQPGSRVRARRRQAAAAV